VQKETNAHYLAAQSTSKSLVFKMKTSIFALSALPLLQVIAAQPYGEYRTGFFPPFSISMANSISMLVPNSLSHI
jgi:hypothetical protein